MARTGKAEYSFGRACIIVRPSRLPTGQACSYRMSYLLQGIGLRWFRCNVFAKPVKKVGGFKRAFSDVQSSYYWSSTSNANNTDNAWNVNLNNGNVNNNNKTNSNYVWPVRGGE